MTIETETDNREENNGRRCREEKGEEKKYEIKARLINKIRDKGRKREEKEIEENKIE